jgi:hypothetical protein
MKLVTVAFSVLVLASGGTAIAQVNNVPSGYGTAAGGAKPLHGGDSSNGMAGYGGGWSDKRANGTVSTGHYQQILAGRLSEAQQMLALVQAGTPLTDRDRKRIRSAMREDFIAWRKQFDPRSAAYREMHDKWLLDEDSLSPEGWAKQRVDWLKAQQEWIARTAG